MSCISMESPCGLLTLREEDGMLTAVAFGPCTEKARETPVLRAAKAQLEEYFSGKRKAFDLPLNPKGTAFQRAVWAALRTIPYGETCSYADLAARASHAGACRAAGSANGKNPLPIIIPCHRVIRTDGSIGGYAGGLAIKRMLLELEKEYA